MMGAAPYVQYVRYSRALRAELEAKVRARRDELDTLALSPMVCVGHTRALESGGWGYGAPSGTPQPRIALRDLVEPLVLSGVSVRPPGPPTRRASKEVPSVASVALAPFSWLGGAACSAGGRTESALYWAAGRPKASEPERRQDGSRFALSGSSTLRFGLIADQDWWRDPRGGSLSASVSASASASAVARATHRTAW